LPLAINTPRKGFWVSGNIVKPAIGQGV